MPDNSTSPSVTVLVEEIGRGAPRVRIFEDRGDADEAFRRRRDQLIAAIVSSDPNGHAWYGDDSCAYFTGGAWLTLEDVHIVEAQALAA